MGGRISEPKHYAADAEGEEHLLKGEMLGTREAEANKRTLEALSSIFCKEVGVPQAIAHGWPSPS